MTSIESILSKDAAYTRFRIAVLVMQEVLAAAPEPVCTEKLERVAECSAGTLARVCANLVQAGDAGRRHCRRRQAHRPDPQTALDDSHKKEQADEQLEEI